MPPRPLHNEPAIPGAPDQPHTSAPNLHTHSSKFPIEREVTLSSTDKNSKIPILNEYLKRPNASIAPDAPHIQMAWIEDKNRNSSLNHAMSSQQAPNLQVFKAQPMTLMDASQLSELSPIRSQDQSNGPPNLSQMSMGAVPKNAHSTPEMENSASKASRTYHTIKDMIQSRFSKNKTEPCTETELNNAENNGSNGITPLSVKPEDSLSPQSQLRQHGVYIGAVSQSPQQQIRTMQQSQVISRNNEIMRRNQEIRDRHLQQQQQPHQQYQPQQHQQQYQQQQPPQQQQQQQHQLYQTPQHYQQLQSQQQYQHPPQHLHHQHQQHQQHTPQQHQLNQLHVQQHQQHLLNQQVYQQSPREKIPDRVMDPPQVEPTQRNHLITESNQKTIYLDSRGLSVHTPNPRQLVNDNETPVSRRMEGVYGQRNIITDTRMAKSQIDLVSSCNNLENQTTPASNLRYSNNNIPADVLRSGQVFSRTPMTPISPYQSKDIKRMDNQRTASDQKIQPPSQPTPNPKPAYLNPRPVEEYSNRIPEMIHYNDQQPMPHPSAYHKVNKEDIAREPVMRNEAEQPSRKDTFQASNQPCESPRENFNSAALSGEDEGGFGKNGGPFSGTSSDYDKMRNGGHSDSGRGSTVYSSGKAGKSERNIDTSPELGSEPHRNTGANENGWVDVVENELRNILDPKLQVNAADSTISESISSLTPPLPPLSPTGSSDEHQQVQYKHKSLPYGNKSEYPPKNSKYVTTQAPCKGMWSARVNAKDKSSHHRLTSSKRNETQKLPPLLLSSHLDIDSMLDNDNSSDEESTTIDTHHAQTIRKQLEALETMYSEVLKLLGVRKNTSHHYQPSDPRVHRRRLHGSMSSLPSSVSSRPVRDKHRRTDERKKVKDIRGINKRFQRLESHVVTLARSVAHLSSEMRTQHIMIQEMEVIRGELAALRTQTNMLTVRSHSVPCAVPAQNTAAAEQVNSSPGKMKKLTKFFGEEPPLMKLFLEKLGYEKYAKLFDKERIGFVELPYLTEERLHKLGIPLGPRLRIMQEAQMGFPTFENTLCVI